MQVKVSAAIKALPSRNELAVHSRRAVAVIECGETVLKLCELEQFQLKFASFSAELLSTLNSTIEGRDIILVMKLMCYFFGLKK